MSVLVIGGGPAGLMAAEVAARAGLPVLVADAKPSLGRKFLMAGKSGLNLTKDEPFGQFLQHYAGSAGPLRLMLDAFGPDAVMRWAEGLGQSLFTGTTGRVFPDVMKASPLLRAWLARLAGMGVETRTRWRWTGWDGDSVLFDTPDGRHSMTPRATVLALGGASWARLGSDGAWVDVLRNRGVGIAPFQPSNVGLRVDWSDHMHPHFGKPVKAVRWRAVVLNGRVSREVASSRGEAILSARGLEGGGIYPLIPALRDNADLVLDLAPDQSAEALAARMPKAPRSLARVLRNTLRWPPEKTALFNEFRPREFPLNGPSLARLIKGLRIRHQGPRPMDEAISTAGGVRFDAVDDTLQLSAIPGTYAAGEMLDWDAPTGGYLLTACLATGAWAGRAISDRLR
jgi:uncharacterized flavoprotein (TIGR03862 family)